MEEQTSYKLDEQDQQELIALQQQLDPLQQKIAHLEGRSPELEMLEQQFHLGMVGRGGHASARLNTRKIASMDKSIETASVLKPLYEKRNQLLDNIHAITDGKRKQQREQEMKREQQRREAQERVLNAAVGDDVVDVIFGLVTVVRKNKKSLTVEMSGGLHEARPFHMIADVVHSKSAKQEGEKQ